MSNDSTNGIGIVGRGEPLDTASTDATEPIATGDAGASSGAFESVKTTGNAGGGGSRHTKRKRGRPPGKHKQRERTAEYEQRNEQRRAERAAEREQEQPRVEPVSYPGAAGREKEAPLRKNLADLTSVILVAHATLAALVNIREFELSEDEAGKLSEASKEVLKHYPLGVSEKTLAWVNLAIVGGGIYGTRFMAYNIRKAAERRARMVNVTPAAAAAAASASSGQAPATGATATNGHAANFDLTPGFLTVPPEGETVL